MPACAGMTWVGNPTHAGEHKVHPYASLSIDKIGNIRTTPFLKPSPYTSSVGPCCDQYMNL